MPRPAFSISLPQAEIARVTADMKRLQTAVRGGETLRSARNALAVTARDELKQNRLRRGYAGFAVKPIQARFEGAAGGKTAEIAIEPKAYKRFYRYLIRGGRAEGGRDPGFAKIKTGLRQKQEEAYLRYVPFAKSRSSRGVLARRRRDILRQRGHWKGVRVQEKRPGLWLVFNQVGYSSLRVVGFAIDQANYKHAPYFDFHQLGVKSLRRHSPAAIKKAVSETVKRQAIWRASRAVR